MPLALYALTAGAFGIGVNEFVIMGLLAEGAMPLGIGAAGVALAVDGSALVADTLRTLTFGGQTATNDIGWPAAAFASARTKPSTDSLTSAYRQLIALAHAHNVRIVGATLTPFEGALSETPLDDYYQAEKDELRQEVNRWIRTGGTFDTIINFDPLLRDPMHPSRLEAPFDSGDHLRPGEQENQAMAEGVDLDALLGSSIGQP